MRRKDITVILAIVLLAGILIFGSQYFQKVKDVIVKPTARELYAREFDSLPPVYEKWNSAFAKASQNSLRGAYQDTLNTFTNNPAFELPYGAVGTYSLDNLTPYVYFLNLSQGEVLYADVETSVDSAQVFLDLFQQKNDSVFDTKPIVSNLPNARNIRLEIKQNGNYILLLHPEIATDASFRTRIYTQPQYDFPVSGKGNKSIQSFWGDPRGGGKRKHKGIDIFAPRGTPLVAVTDGVISSTGNRGLGGKQVWLRDGLFGQSLYYAHLDSIIATRGQRVKVGDTLGFVGNTGNAKTTPPHLHFGIYRSTGAVNPLAFVKYQAVPETGDYFNATQGTIKRTANLRLRPTSKAQRITQLKRRDTLLLLEKTANWYRVLKDDSLEGFVYKTSVDVLHPQ